MKQLLSLFKPSTVNADFLIANGTQLEEFRKDIKNDGAIILKEFPRAGETCTGFQTCLSSPELCIKYSSPCFTLNYSDGIRLTLNIQDGVVRGGGILLQHDKDKWKQLISIYGRDKIEADGISHYEINWSGIGSVSSVDAKEFSLALNLSAIVADELKEILDKKKL